MGNPPACMPHLRLLRGNNSNWVAGHRHIIQRRQQPTSKTLSRLGEALHSVGFLLGALVRLPLTFKKTKEAI